MGLTRYTNPANLYDRRKPILDFSNRHEQARNATRETASHPCRRAQAACRAPSVVAWRMACSIVGASFLGPSAEREADHRLSQMVGDDGRLECRSPRQLHCAALAARDRSG